MKPVNLNQLLFHPKCDTLSFFWPALTRAPLEQMDVFINDMEAQLAFQGKTELARILESKREQIKKISNSHQNRGHAFYLAEELQGYVIIDSDIDSFCMMGTSFHVRPLLEELFSSPEFLIVNVSLYDIKIFRGDFQHLEIIQQFDYDQLPNSMELNTTRLFAPQYLGLIPYRTLVAIKTIAQKIKDMVLYNSMPVIVTGLEEMKNIFLRYFNYATGVITHIHEDFYEKSCMEILERSRIFRPVVLDFYSEQLKDRLKRMMKSRLIISEMRDIISAAREGRINHLVLPLERKVYGTIDFESGEFEIHQELKLKKNSVDILGLLAEEVVRQGGKIQLLRPHFFPAGAQVLAVIKGN